MTAAEATATDIEAAAVPRASVVVLNWNGRRFLPECLTSLRQQTLVDMETILVDNGSTDGSIDLVRRSHPEVRIVALDHNRGFSAGTNAGIRAARGRYVALLNNDTRVDCRWLEELVSALDNRPAAGFCASKILRWDDPGRLDAAGDCYYPWGMAAKRGSGRPDGPSYSAAGYVFGSCAGAALYRRELLEDVGLLDEDLFAYDEDVDLSFRAQLRGYACLYAPAAIVYHHGRGATGLANADALFLARRNALTVLLKNMPWPLLVLCSPLIAAYHLLGDVRWVARGYARPVLRARAENWRQLGGTFAKRRSIQAGRRASLGHLASLMVLGQRVVPA